MAARLRLVATTVGRTETALGAFGRRLAARIGKAEALTATARKIAVPFYRAMRFGMQYEDPGAEQYDQRYRRGCPVVEDHALDTPVDQRRVGTERRREPGRRQPGPPAPAACIASRAPRRTSPPGGVAASARDHRAGGLAAATGRARFRPRPPRT